MLSACEVLLCDQLLIEDRARVVAERESLSLSENSNRSESLHHFLEALQSLLCDNAGATAQALNHQGLELLWRLYPSSLDSQHSAKLMEFLTVAI